MVLRSALVKMRVYYAAVEQVVAATDKREVWGAVCLVDYNPRDREGYIFGYSPAFSILPIGLTNLSSSILRRKSLSRISWVSEPMGPCECDCPDAILDLLIPTDHQYAEEWRARCRDNAAERRARCAKPTPRAGQTIIFDTPFSFSNGQRLDRFDVVANPRNHRTVLYRAHGSSGLYRISNVKHKHYQLL
jgi:hypothetical protein